MWFQIRFFFFFLFVVQREQMKSQLGKQFKKPQHWPLWLLVPLLLWGPRGGRRRTSKARHKLLTLPQLV